MQRKSFLHQHLTSLTAAVACMFYVATANAADSFAGGVLTLSSLAIGNATYTNVAISPITVSDILAVTVGGIPYGSEDHYDPGTSQLTIPSIKVGSTTYTNVVVAIPHTVSVSIGGVTGADTFDGTNLRIAYVQRNGTVYSNVVVSENLGDVVSIAGGMPTAGPDTYSSLSNRLAIPGVQVGGRVFTNVVVKLGTLQQSQIGIAFNNQETVLHPFYGCNEGVGCVSCVANNASTDGSVPAGTLIQAKDGNFYGTTNSGGRYGCYGTVFKISPANNYAESVLYSFCPAGGSCANGYGPRAGLIQGKDGNFYGTTWAGGAYNNGTVFKVTTAGVETVVYSFCPTALTTGKCPDGQHPNSALIQASDGNFYGTAGAGTKDGGGVVFKVTPAGVEVALYSFDNTGINVDALNPAGVMQASDGNLYGAAVGGGSYGFGAIFKITLAGVETLFYSFCANGADTNTGFCADGQNPTGLIQGSDDNFYVTADGGTYGFTLFRFTLAGTESVLHSFCGDLRYIGCTDSGQPTGLIQASDGNFYGPAGGGANNWGSVFKITPTGVETVIYSFLGDNSSNTSGLNPVGSLLQARDGAFYGMTINGPSAGPTYTGPNDWGAVYKLTNVAPLP